MRPGDYLGRIAARVGVSVGELKRDNGLGSDVIHPRQKLKIARPLHRLQAADIAWHNPLGSTRSVLRPFGPYQNARGMTMPRPGADVSVAIGTRVRSPAHGVVRFVGEADGFGTIVIVEHGAGYSTVLAPLDATSIGWQAGDVVLARDELGRTGHPVEGDQPYLHVELRRREKAVDPARLLR